LEFFKYVDSIYNMECLNNFNKDNQYYDLCVYAVKLNGDNFQYVKNKFKTFELCKLAVEIDPYNLEFIKQEYQTFKLCKEAFIKIDYCPDILMYIKYPSTDFFKFVSDTYKEASLKYFNENYQDEELCLYAIELNFENFEYVNKKLQTYDMCYKVVKQNGEMLKYVNDEFKTYKLCKKAVKQNYKAIKYSKYEF